MTSGPILLAIDARGVATVTLNRPKVNNAEAAEGLASFAEKRAARWAERK